MVALQETMVAADPAETADLVEALDRRLAAAPAVDEFAALQVNALAATIAASGRSWMDADPEAAMLTSAAALAAQLAAGRRDHEDARRDLRSALGQMLYGLTTIAEAEPVSAGRPAKDVARWLVAHSEVSQAEVADLLGTPTRTLQRWISDEPAAPTGADASRVRTLAQVFGQLRHVFTPAGAVLWLRSPNGHFDDSSPADVLAGDPAQAARVVELARSLRFQTAS